MGVALLLCAGIVSADALRAAAAERATRREPGTFIEESVTAQNGEVTLAGVLTRPTTPGPYPAAVVVHGSGRATRNQRSFWSTLLVQKGIAVLRYDKRGVGESTGAYEDVGPFNSPRVLPDLARDALAWVEFLRADDRVAEDQVGLVGNSQAGWIIPLAASMSTNVAFMVNVVGPMVTVSQEIYYSSLTQEQQFRADGTVNGYTVEQLTELTRNFPGYSGRQGFNPIPALLNVKAPGLWILGEYDESIPTALTIENLEGVMQDSGQHFEIQVKPRANHGLIDVVTGRNIPFITNPGGARDWILATVGDPVAVQTSTWSRIKVLYAEP